MKFWQFMTVKDAPRAYFYLYWGILTLYFLDQLKDGW